MLLINFCAFRTEGQKGMNLIMKNNPLIIKSKEFAKDIIFLCQEIKQKTSETMKNTLN